ncbi:hypothetical protein [Stackebrandtia soli]|uniref:hypothetical protein n=1 Tax=Stackebrandtia soli TaxID=1892856 RepID=UPI0039EC4903
MSDALLRAGLAPLDGDTGQPLSARTYEHPGLGDRPVVRLVGERVAPAEDGALAYLGFGEPTVSAPRSRTVLHGLEYPAWALVNDPANGQVALGALREMERAAKTAVGSPAKAERSFIVIANKLPHTHLPSFYEQAGRLFTGAGRAHFAGRMFGRARENEAVYALPIDESLRRESYLEFALAGALTVKALTSYFDELSAKHSATHARDVFAELAIGRIRGGQPPWAAMSKQWRRLNTEAGENAAEAERRLFAEILDAPVMKSAPVALWKESRSTLVELGTRDAKHRRTLLHLFPSSQTYKTAEHHAFIDWWLELLEDIGGPAALDTPDAAVSWLEQLGSKLQGPRSGMAPSRVAGWVEQLAPLCKSPVNLGGSRYAAVNIDLVSLCLSNGIQVAPPIANSNLNLAAWNVSGTTDIAPLMEDPHFRKLVSRALSTSRGDVVGAKKLRPAVREWLSDLREEGEIGGVPAAMVSVNAYLKAGGATDPEFIPKVTSVDLTAAVRRSLHMGLIDELHWPDFDAAVRELGTSVQVTSSWPVLVVYNMIKAIAIGPQGRVAEHELRLPAGRSKQSPIVRYSDGAFFVAWRENNDIRLYWSNEPEAVHSSTAQYWDSRGVRGFCMLDADGARLTSNGPQRRGDRWMAPSADFLSDGTNYWETRSHGVKGVDGWVNRLPNAPWPRAPLTSPGKWDPQLSSLAPLQPGMAETPLGTDGGLIGFHVARHPNGISVTGMDGRHAFSSRWTEPWGVLDIPERSHRMVVDGTSRHNLTDEDGHPFTFSTGLMPPTAFWHFLRARDPRTSRLLRDITDEQVATLIAAAEKPATKETEPPSEPTPLDKAIAELGITDAALARGVSRLVLTARDVIDRRALALDPPKTQEQAPLPVDETTVSVEALAPAVTGLEGRYSRNATLATTTRVLTLLLTGATDIVTARSNNISETGLDALNRLAVLAVRGVSPIYTDETRASVRQLFVNLSTSPLLSGNVRYGVVQTEQHIQRGSAASGSLFATLNARRMNGMPHLSFIEMGEPERPVEPTTIRTLTPTWGNPERLAEYAAATKSTPVMELDEEAVATLAGRTGLGRSAAILLLVGLPNFEAYEKDFLGKEIREQLGISTKQATAAQIRLAPVRNQLWANMYERALDTDATLVFDQRRFADRLADVWIESHGAYPEISDEDVLRLEKLGIAGRIGTILRHLSGTLDPSRPEPVDSSLVGLLHTALVWAYSRMPGGSAYLSGFPAVLERVREALKDQTVTRSLGTFPTSSFPEELLTGDWEPSTNGRGQRMDAGLIVASAWGFQWSYYSVSFRPALLTDDVFGDTLRAMDSRGEVAETDWLRGDDATAFAAHAASIPAGRFAADPRVSAPDVVTAVMDAHALGEDAATLYLQLLTVFNPTDQDIRMWNDWKAARHKKAITELASTDLVLEAKRARAGRGLFIPGGWKTEKAPRAPYETWKKKLYPNPGHARLTPHTTYTALFTRAWELVKSGDGPK